MPSTCRQYLQSPTSHVTLATLEIRASFLAERLDPFLSVRGSRYGGERLGLVLQLALERAVRLQKKPLDSAVSLRRTGSQPEFAERGVKVDYRSVWEFVHAEKRSFKKSVVAGERDRPDVARRRAQWITYRERVEPERLVFIDETWTGTDMAAFAGMGTARPEGFLPRFHTTAGRP